MTRRDEIIRMAREADCLYVNLTGDRAAAVERLTRFAALVAAEKQEQCANKCNAISDDFSKRYGDFNGEELGADTCAEAIRALSDEAMQ